MFNTLHELKTNRSSLSIGRNSAVLEASKEKKNLNTRESLIQVSTSRSGLERKREDRKVDEKNREKGGPTERKEKDTPIRSPKSQASPLVRALSESHLSAPRRKPKTKREGKSEKTEERKDPRKSNPDQPLPFKHNFRITMPQRSQYRRPSYP